MTQPLRIGIVCPYSFDAPGGVQFHIRDLAEALMERGHTVQVLAPAEESTPLPDYITAAGRAVPVRFNGSVARLTFGPRTNAKVRRWLEAGQFDVVHLHEPMTPSLSMLALWASTCPVVCTFHTSLVRSRALQFAHPLAKSSLEKIDARIAVSEDARRTLIDHLGGDAVVIPNGVYVDRFAVAEPSAEWRGTDERPTIAFLGRLDEPRKGLPVLTAAVPAILAERPGARILVAGRGEAGREQAIADLGEHAHAVEFLGGITDDEKASMLASVDLYIAPQTGGESFGIVLVEAMSAGAAVIASDIGAFSRVLDDGDAGGLFAVGDPPALAAAVSSALSHPDVTARRRERASVFVRQFDWSSVTGRVLAVYETVLAARDAGRDVGRNRSFLSRLTQRTRSGGGA